MGGYKYAGQVEGFYMTPERKLEYLKLISQTHRSQFDGRRGYEWKIVLTLLTFYVLSVTAKYKYPNDIQLPPCWWVWFIICLLTGITIIYLANVHMANNKNKTFAERAEGAIVEILKGEDPERLLDLLFSLSDEHCKYWVSWHGFFKHICKGYWFLQSLTLSIFAIVSAYLLTNQFLVKPLLLAILVVIIAIPLADKLTMAVSLIGGKLAFWCKKRKDFS